MGRLPTLSPRHRPHLRGEMETHILNHVASHICYSHDNFMAFIAQQGVQYIVMNTSVSHLSLASFWSSGWVSTKALKCTGSYATERLCLHSPTRRPVHSRDYERLTSFTSISLDFKLGVRIALKCTGSSWNRTHSAPPNYGFRCSGLSYNPTHSPASFGKADLSHCYL